MENKKFTLSVARKVARLLQGETLPSSSFPRWLADELQAEGLMTVVTHGSRIAYRLLNVDASIQYIKNKYTGGAELSRWMELADGQNSHLERSTLVTETGDSKLVRLRTFRGFLVNCCEPLEVMMGEKAFTLSPVEGMACFVQEPERFRIPSDVLIVGVENGDNFRQLHRQRYLFKARRVLFVSRYPQSKDLRNWLLSIPNAYLHFGDFDLAGIHIYLTEFYKYLGNRSSFFVPDDIEERLKHGNSTLYDRQYARFCHLVPDDVRLIPLVEMIHHYHRVYEQEGYIAQG